MVAQIYAHRIVTIFVMVDAKLVATHLVRVSALVLVQRVHVKTTVKLIVQINATLLVNIHVESPVRMYVVVPVSCRALLVA